ncbi:TPA: hypothetical protein KLB92_001705, partial [Campylobacter jejuni]|nr:hypothetical protein [Campylobacter jejuni]
IKKAIQYWKFDLAEYIYETNYLNYKELKVEYVYFLIQTGQLNKIIFLFQDEQDNFLIEKCYFLKQDINLKQLIFYLKNIDNLIIGNIDFSNLFTDYFFVKLYEFNCKLKYGNITAKNIEENFNFILYQSAYEISKAYYIAKIIDYFLVSNKKEDEKFFVPLEYNKLPYSILSSLQRDFPSHYGSIMYYDLFTKKTKDIINKSITITPIPKIAICLYGLFRGDWKKTLERTLEQFAKPLNADVFIFTWEHYAQWSGFAGGPTWAWRVLNEDIRKIMPDELKNNNDMWKLFPRVTSKLCAEYMAPLKLDDLENIKLEYPCIKTIYTENQKEFEQSRTPDNPFSVNGTSYLQYGVWKSFQLAQEYEYKNNIKYDFVAIIRNDSEPCGSAPSIDDLLKLNFNDVCDDHIPAGMFSIGNIIGRRFAIETFANWYHYRPYLETSPLFYYSPFAAHESAMKHSLVHNLRICKGLLPMIYAETLCLKGMRLPNISLELKQDLEYLKNDKNHSKIKIQEFEDFFVFLKNYFKPLSDNAYKYSRNSNGDNGHYHILDNGIIKIENSLSFQLGKVMISNSKTFSGYILMPFKLIRTIQIWKKEKKHFPSLPLHFYSDYDEALKLKNSFTYKIGELLIHAHRKWYLGGYLEFYWKLLQLKQKLKNKKSRDKIK